MTAHENGLNTYRSIVQRRRNNSDDTIWEAQGFVEFLRRSNHVIEMLPAILWLADDELFDLLELMHAKQTPRISAMAASLLAETRTVTAVFDGKLAWQ
jgi:hypothetical protein